MRLRHVVLTTSLLALLFTGCFMSHMTTARPVGDGNFSLGGGLGISIAQGFTYSIRLLEARLDYGITENIDVGIQTGLASTPYPMFSGVGGSVKYTFLDDPDSVSIAVGANIRMGLIFERSLAGVSLYVDSNLPFLPLFLSLHPGNYHHIAFGDKFYFGITAGLHFDLGDTTRLLLGATIIENFEENPSFMDYKWNFGAGVQFIL